VSKFADRHRERAQAALMEWERDWLTRGDSAHSHLHFIALALAAVERETIERCENAVDEVARRFRAAHDPMSENAADECYAAIRALADRKEG
jgi:alcohol dehydrogenase class IV